MIKRNIGESVPSNLNELISEIRELVYVARKSAAQTVNTLQVLTNFEIGRRIVEYEQKGTRRAEYGTAMLEKLARILTKELGKGFSLTNLKLMRQFDLTYQNKIGQTVSDFFSESPIGQTTSDQPLGQNLISFSRRKARQVNHININLSWSHYVFLMKIRDPNEREFYEIESSRQRWSLRELKRQFDSGLYERLALSRDKEGLRRLASEGQIITRPEDLLKEPYVLEFLGLDEKTNYSESDLESAIIDKLEQFLLELGKGFLFEARQKRFTFDEEHFFIDLVFYNRILRCYVLIDLKIGKLTHQDLGQMQMYVNYFDRYVKLKDENPTVGIILCKQKNNALVEITLPQNAHIHAKEYMLYLPDKNELRQKLLDWIKEQEN